MQQIIVYILRLHDKGVKVADEVTELFAGELNPVAAKAQRKVPVPDGSVFLTLQSHTSDACNAVSSRCSLFFLFFSA